MREAAEHTGAEALVESGRYGRIFVIRLKPNQDMIEGVETAAAELGATNAVVRSAVGSLVDAALGYGAGDSRSVTSIEGPGIEILTLSGEIRPDAEGRPIARLRGTVSDSDARVYGGVFLRGANPICITLEIVMQEWIPQKEG
jgi:predicted DNA-binding protein with PD1-like motif